MKPGPKSIGAIAALGTVPLHVAFPGASPELAAITLGAIGAIYVGFALIDGRPEIIALEAAVALLFILAAVGSLLATKWLAPSAMVAHGAWDYAHHRISTRMPRWYVPFCAVYDWVFAATLSAVWLYFS